MDTSYVHGLAEQIHQAGLDEAADVLANWLTEQRKIQAEDDGVVSQASQHYLDGAEDALLTLIQAGAADPRPASEQVYANDN